MTAGQLNTRLNDKFLANSLFDERSATGLDEGQLRRLAPSIFAETAHESRSERFQVIPTWNAVQALMKEGFVPVAAKQGGTRIQGKQNFTKHLIRFRHGTAAMQGNDEMLPEIILRNAADGTSAYRIMSGLFRPICRNGLISADVVEDFKVGHVGNVVNKVIEGTWRVVGETQRVVEQADSWQGLRLNRDEREIFAEAVHTLRFADSDEYTRQAINPAQLLAPKRPEDQNRWDLWTTFNVLQENAIRGGQHGVVNRRNEETGENRIRQITVRPLSSIDGDTALNKALWVLSSRFAALKGA
jgi:Domain of unknown function (DUF932)